MIKLYFFPFRFSARLLRIKLKLGTYYILTNYLGYSLFQSLFVFRIPMPPDSGRKKDGVPMVWSKSCRKWSEKSSPYALQWFDMKKLESFRNHTIALKCIQTTFFLIIFCNFYSTPYTILSLPVSSGIIYWYYT